MIVALQEALMKLDIREEKKAANVSADSNDLNDDAAQLTPKAKKARLP